MGKVKITCFLWLALVLTGCGFLPARKTGIPDMLVSLSATPRPLAVPKVENGIEGITPVPTNTTCPTFTPTPEVIPLQTEEVVVEEQIPTPAHEHRIQESITDDPVRCGMCGLEYIGSRTYVCKCDCGEGYETVEEFPHAECLVSPREEEVRYTTDKVTVRAAATSDSRKLGTLPPGERVVVSGISSDEVYVRIEYGNVYGFIRRWYTSKKPKD